MKFDLANVLAIFTFGATFLCVAFDWGGMTYERAAYFMAVAAYFKAESIRMHFVLTLKAWVGRV